MSEFQACSVWDASIRWFHGIKLVCMSALIAIAVVILNAKAPGVSTDGKILLKNVHVRFVHVFAANPLWRLVWAFSGGTSASAGEYPDGSHFPALGVGSHPGTLACRGATGT